MNRHTIALALGAAVVLILRASGTLQAVEVKFQVNMQVQTEALSFNPATDTMELHGSFDGWGPGIALAESQADTDIREGTVDLTGDPGAEVQFKYVIHKEDDTLVWEVDGVGPEGAQNRAVEVPESPATLPVVFFNNQTEVPGNVSVTFQVDMSIQMLIGNFIPDTDDVEVHGSFDGWGAGFTLAASPTDADIYLGTTDILGSPETVIEYKFVINQGDILVWEANVGPDGGDGNRSFVLGETSQTLPIVFFNNLDEDPGAGIQVTFSVNMEIQAALGLFDPQIDSVTVAGQFNNWNEFDSPLANSPAGLYLYQGTYQVIGEVGSSAPYKFVMSGSVWEEGDNRTFTLEDSDQILPIAYFNRQDGQIMISRVSDTEIMLEWTAIPDVLLQTSTTLTSGWEDVPDTTGQGTATLPIEDGKTFFRLSGP